MDDNTIQPDPTVPDVKLGGGGRKKRRKTRKKRRKNR